jgi:hypothetical protein
LRIECIKHSKKLNKDDKVNKDIVQVFFNMVEEEKVEENSVNQLAEKN